MSTTAGAITRLAHIAPEYHEGYRPSAPPATGWVDGEGIDRGICEAAHCERCRHRGLEYHPYFRREPRSYRAFAVCPACGHAFEF